MCVTPSLIHIEKGPKYEPLEVPCGFCWACLKNIRDDIEGRALCEAYYSDWSIFLTLTYDDKKCSPEQSKILHKHDLQNFLKHFRRSYNTRYIAAGEYGSRATKRAHFHVVLFGTGTPPPIPEHQTTHIKWWPWGHVFCVPADRKKMAYVAKYLTKQKDPKHNRDETPKKEWFTRSTRPPIGYRFLMEVAQSWADQRVVPRDFAYYPPGGKYGTKYNVKKFLQNYMLHQLTMSWPEWRYLPKTEGMENAHLRYTKWRLQKEFDFLPYQERARLYKAQDNPPWPQLDEPKSNPLQKYRPPLLKEYQDEIDRLAKQTNDEAIKWLADQRALVPAHQRPPIVLRRDGTPYVARAQTR